MESFIEEYIRTELTTAALDDVSEELLLERRISPYATLRPGDLATLLKLHTALPFPGTGGCKAGGSFDIRDVVFSSGAGPIQEILAREEQRLDEDSSSATTTTPADLHDVTCRGQDQGHVPAVYKVKDIHVHEMPVVGVYVDPRVCPGFKYRVRRAGSDSFFYGGQARTLESVGMGYGRRLTFKGESLNNNDAYFWSDSHPEGFAFSIHAVSPGLQFLVVDGDEAVVGEANVVSVHEQLEVDMTSGKAGVTKKIKVNMTMALTYYHKHHHGLVEMTPRESEEVVTGEAELHKGRGMREAGLSVIDSVYLQRWGMCKLLPDV